MKLYGKCYFGPFEIDTEYLEKPNKNLAKIINEESIKFDVKADFYVTSDKKIEKLFAGCAFLTETSTYAICLSGWAFKSSEEYLRYIIRHEFRHCDPTKETLFRYHDMELWDIGFDPPSKIGFFKEDFVEISDDPILRSAFRNVIFKKGIFC